MAIVFGVCNSAPVAFKDLLLTKRLFKEKDIAIVKSGSTLSKVKPVLFFLGVVDLFRNAELLNSKKCANVIVYVFASPIKLREVLGIYNLDLAEDTKYPGYGYCIKKLSLQSMRSIMNTRRQVHIEKASVQHLEAITSIVKDGSLLMPLMTFIYTLPYSTLQTPVKYAVANIVVGLKSVDKFDSILKMYTSAKLSPESKEKLLSILNRDTTKAFIAAFKHFAELKEKASEQDPDAKKPIPIQRIASKYKLPLYELRYLAAVQEHSKVYRNPQ